MNRFSTKVYRFSVAGFRVLDSGKILIRFLFGHRCHRVKIVVSTSNKLKKGGQIILGANSRSGQEVIAQLDPSGAGWMSYV